MIFDVTFQESKQTFNVTFKEVEKIDNTRPVVIEPLEIIENGEYYAENIDGFNPVNVNVPLKYEEGYADGYQASQESITLQEKTITENGEFKTDEGFTGMSKVTVAVPIKEEQEKTVEITKNGTTEVVADEGKSMSKVTVNTNVAFDGELGKPYIDTSKITDFSHFCEGGRLSDELDKFDTSNGTNFKEMFYGNTKITTIPLLDTSKGTDFEAMFYNSSIESIPKLNTSKGTSFESMFFQCKKLTTIPQLDTSKGENFNSMFYNSSIESIPQLDTGNGREFGSMFNSCRGLTTAPKLNTSNGIYFGSMFNNCEKLVVVPQLDTSKGTEFHYMFGSCKELTAGPQLDTSNGTTFNSMFYKCISITSIPQLDTSNGKNFSSMFAGCTGLEAVALTTAKSNLSTNTFQVCSALKNITIGEGWNVNIYLHFSEQLTVESLHGMIENLADLTGQTAKTFQVGATNLAKIDAEHLTMLQNKNWNYS